MDMQDNELDAWISAALRPETTTSEQRKREIREQIIVQAARQPMLLPLLVEDRPRFAERILFIGRAVCDWAATLATDEAQYERARQNHNAFRYGGPSRDGRLVLQFMNPMGFNLVSPTI